MRTKKLNKLNTNLFFSFLIGFSLTTSRISIDVGFSIKPIMLVAGIIGLYILLINVINDKIEFKLNKLDNSLLVFFVIYSLSFIFAVNKFLSLRYILGFALYIIIYKIVSTGVNISQHKFIDYFVLGSSSGLILGLIYYLFGLYKLNFIFAVENMRYFGVFIDRSMPRYIGFTSIDPNTAFMNITVGLFATYLVKNNYFKLMSYIIHISCALLTMSRGGLLGATISIILGLTLLIIISISKSNKIKGFLNLRNVLILLLLLCLLIISDLPMLILRRFKVNDGGSGRTNLWNVGFDIFKNSNYLGVGIFNLQLYLTEALSRPANLHNTQLDILFEGGLPSLISYFYFASTVFIVTWKNIKNKRIIILSLIFISLSIQQLFLSALLHESFFITLAFISSSLTIKEKRFIDIDAVDKRSFKNESEQ